METKAGQIQAQLRLRQLEAPALVTEAYGHSVAASVAIIKQLNQQIATLEHELSASFEMHPDAEIYLSLPGLGHVLGARALAEFGDDRQKKKFLQPLLDGKTRSCFSMTEPEVSSADPTQLTTLAKRDGDTYVLNGHKWFTSGAIGADFAIVMAVTDPAAAPHQRASMILVPTTTPGFKIVRAVSVMGHVGRRRHCEIRYEDCRVPAEYRLGPEGAASRSRRRGSGPGASTTACAASAAPSAPYEIMVSHAAARKVGGEPLGTKQFIQDFIAKSKMEIDQARVHALPAWKMDTVGKKEAAQEISMIKVIAANLRSWTCATGRSRPWARSASPTTRRSRRCGATAARCASRTAPTRYTKW